MRYSLRMAILAIPILSGILPFGALGSEPVSVPAIASESPGYQAWAVKGVEAMREGKSDSAAELFMAAHDSGMSKDSLYFFLAEAAFGHSAFDTAMAFNLAIGTPAAGNLREPVLDQRFRIYLKAGLEKDAAAVADSMAEKPKPPSRRNHELNIRFSSGYYREDDYPATHYPFGSDLGAIRLEGAQFRNRAQLIWPLFQTARVPWSGGVEYDLIKSYAKDSLDYRAGLLLKADNLVIDSLSTTVSAEMGNVSGTGLVSSYKFESAFLSFSHRVITMILGGVESEWTDAWENRFNGFWISFYRDHSFAKGRGVNYSLSISGIAVDPIRETTPQKVMYVDDVTKESPTHYRNSAFQDSIPSKSISTFYQYISNTGPFTSSVSPQGFVTVVPNLGYAFPLPFSISAEMGAHYALTLFPEPYAWSRASLPEEFANVKDDFEGFALNQADGKHYVARLNPENGGNREEYGSAPLRSVERVRIDQQAGVDVSFRRRLARLGTLSLDGGVKRNWSTVSGIAPIWIPEWDFGAALKWSKGWTW